MKTKKQIQEKIKKLSNDERLKEADASIEINAPLALIQVDLKAKIAALLWVLED